MEDVITPGWAASNYGGGVVRTNEELAAFLEEANSRVVFPRREGDTKAVST